MFKQTLLAASVAAALAAGAAQAESITIDVAGAGGTGLFGGPSGTGLFDQLQFFSNTTTTQFDTDASGGLSLNDAFADTGNANITGPIPSTYFAGINFGLSGGGIWSEITVSWNNLNGYLSGINPDGSGGINVNQVYTSGTFNFYYDQPGDHSYGATIGSGDDTGMTDGTLVLTLQLDPSVASTGLLNFNGSGQFTSGSSAIHTVVTFAQPGFWFLNGTTDFASLLLNQQIILSFIDQNTDDIVQTACAPTEGCLFKIDSNHDGSINFQTRPVPVPGTVGLLGGALLALGAANLRKKKA